MQTLKQLFRKNYLGEDIITARTYAAAQWAAESEYMPNQIANMQVSNRAVVLGNGPTRQAADLRLIKNNQAGLRGRLKLQTYGCNAIYRDFEPDFLVVTGTGIAAEVVRSGYPSTHIVYASTELIVQYPNNFYVIPQDPRWNAGALAAYLAAFDGHTRIFLLGFDGNDDTSRNYNVYADTANYPATTDLIAEEFWTKTMKAVFDTYPDVDFVRVTPTENYRMPEEWRYCLNLRQIDYNRFAIEADL